MVAAYACAIYNDGTDCCPACSVSVAHAPVGAQRAMKTSSCPRARHLRGCLARPAAIFRADGHAACGATADENLTAEGAKIAEAFRFSAPSASSAVIFRADVHAVRAATVDENLTAEGAKIAEAFRFSAPSASSAVIFRAGCLARPAAIFRLDGHAGCGATAHENGRRSLLRPGASPGVQRLNGRRSLLHPGASPGVRIFRVDGHTGCGATAHETDVAACCVPGQAPASGFSGQMPIPGAAPRPMKTDVAACCVPGQAPASGFSG